jgi:hypothetical protein
MKIRFLFFIFLLIVVIQIFTSCKKADSNLAEIKFILPSANSYQNIGDTMTIKAAILSETNIESVEFEVLDKDKKYVFGKTIFTDIKEINPTFDFQIIIEDQYLEGGSFWVHCAVNNDGGLKHKYIEFNIIGLTTKLTDVMVLVAKGSQMYSYSQGEFFQNNSQLLWQAKMDLAGDVFIPYRAVSAVAGKFEGDVVMRDYISQDTLLLIPNSAPHSFPFITSVISFNSLFVLGYYDGKIQFYNYLGQPQGTRYCDANYYPEQICATQRYLWIDQKLIGSTQRLLKLFVENQNSLWCTFNLNGSLIDAYDFEFEDMLLFYNNSSGGKIARYYYAQNAINHPTNYVLDSIRSVTQIDETHYLIATKSLVYFYQYSSASVTPYLNIAGVSKIEYEPINDLLYLSKENQIQIYRRLSAQLLAEKVFDGQVSGFQLIYTK